jgi:hypothetical protein
MNQTTIKLEKVVSSLLSQQYLFDEDIQYIQDEFIIQFYKTLEVCFDKNVTPYQIESFKLSGNHNDIRSIMGFVAHVTENEKSYVILNYFLLRFLQTCAQGNRNRENFIDTKLAHALVTQNDLLLINSRYIEIRGKVQESKSIRVRENIKD